MYRLRKTGLATGEGTNASSKPGCGPSYVPFAPSRKACAPRQGVRAGRLRHRGTCSAAEETVVGDGEGEGEGVCEGVRLKFVASVAAIAMCNHNFR